MWILSIHQRESNASHAAPQVQLGELHAVRRARTAKWSMPLSEESCAARRRSRLFSLPSSLTRGRQSLTRRTGARQRTQRLKTTGSPVSSTVETIDEGRVRFPGSRRPARWLRWTRPNEPQALLKVFMQTWGLPPPSSLISVIGTVDAERGWMTEQQEMLLCRGLRRVLEKTSG